MFYHCSLLLEIVISIFKSNKYGESIPETLKQVRKLILNIYSSRTTVSIKICINQGSPEKQNQLDIN